MELSKIIEKNLTEPLAATEKCGYPIGSHRGDESYMQLEKRFPGYPHPTQSHQSRGREVRRPQRDSRKV